MAVNLRVVSLSRPYGRLDHWITPEKILRSVGEAHSKGKQSWCNIVLGQKKIDN